MRRNTPPVYYNEFEPYAAQWLRNLIADGLLPYGDVDDRNIRKVRASDVKGYAHAHFFAGIGGWPLALQLAGWPLERRIWTGSCPCQPFSLAGRRQGFDDERDLWPTWFNLVTQSDVPVLVGEQVASEEFWLDRVRIDLEKRDFTLGAAILPACSVDAPHKRDRFWFMAVAQCADAGGWGYYRPGQHQAANGARASDQSLRSGPSHRAGVDVDDSKRQGRQGHAGNGAGQQGRPQARRSAAAASGALSNANGVGLRREPSAGREPESRFNSRARHGSNSRSFWSDAQWAVGADGKARRVKPGIRLLADGVAARLAKLSAAGNAIVPQVAAEFVTAGWEAIEECSDAFEAYRRRH